MKQRELMNRSLASIMEDLISINKTIDEEETNRSLLKHLNQSDSLTREHLATLYAIKEDLLVRLNREKRENYLK